MFQIGDLIIYSTHGLCKIEKICEKTLFGATRTYYVVQPLDDSKLTLSVPVDNRSVYMSKVINKKEAEKMLECFKLPGIPWIERSIERKNKYAEVAKTGKREDIVKIIVTLLR